MNSHVITEYAGAHVEVSAFLVPLLPHDLPLKDWPTYCGAGKGFGDWLVPDLIPGAYIQFPCFQHDIDWALADGSKDDYWKANARFLRNLRTMVRAQIADEDSLEKGLYDCEWYYMGVSSPIGWSCYHPSGQDWRTNPVVKEKLHRLSCRDLGIS